jgi:hypothetical protein
MTKPYFAKYLPVDSDVQQGDLARIKRHTIIEHPTLGPSLLTEEDELIFLHKNEEEYWFCVKKHHGTGTSGIGLSRGEFNKVRPFLCSRDIQVGDTFNHIGYHESRATTISDGLVYNGTAHRFKVENCWKVIGEISPEAKWVKEGDEYDYGEVRINYSCEKGNECDLYFGEQLCSAPHKLLDPIKIKGPCGHFH